MRDSHAAASRAAHSRAAHSRAAASRAASSRAAASGVTVDLRDLRVAGGLMLGAALLAPALPGPDGLPCPLRSLTGIPCPLCGMTTSVTALVHLDPVAALAANPAGVVAVIVAVGLLVCRRRRQARVPVWALPAALAVMWIWQLARFHVI